MTKKEEIPRNSQFEPNFHSDAVSIPNQSYYRWVMLALLWFLYFSFGLITRSIAPLVTPILRDLRMNYSQMGTILGSWQLAYILVSIFAGTIIDKWGIRKSLLIGVVTIGTSALLRYFPEGFTGMLLAVALFGVGGPMISIGCPKSIAVWFQGRDRGTAVGTYMTGSYIGMLTAFMLTNSFVMPLTGYSWRLTFVIYALMAFLIALLWWFLARDVRLTVTAKNPGITETFTKLIRIRNVQIILIMGLLSFAIIHGFSNWLPKILEAKGLSPTSAGFIASIPIVSGIPALLSIPRIMPIRFRPRFVAFSAFLTILTLLLIVTTSGTLQVIGLILHGITGSGFLPILILILMDTPEVEPRLMGSVGGLFFCIAEIGGFTGPFIMGFLADFTGTFLAGTIFFVVLSLAIISLTFMLRIEAIVIKKEVQENQENRLKTI
jgi:cyanate permease